MTYLFLLLAVLGVNLLPAFGPPTWSVIVLFSLHSEANPVVLVLTAAAAAACGRYVLAWSTRRLARHLPERATRNLAAAGEVLSARKRGTIVALGVFALSPVPSAQLFEAAGLMRVALGPFVTMFFLGRMVSYSLYVGGAQAVSKTGVGQTLLSSLKSPTGIALQVLMFAALVAASRFDWTRRVPAPGTVGGEKGSDDPWATHAAAGKVKA